MQKRFGQNFLLDAEVRMRILREVRFPESREGWSWEIGPGLGSLTYPAGTLWNQLAVFEIDHGFAEFIRIQYDGIQVFEGDFLKTWRRALDASGKPVRVFGNLPYNAASAIIAALLENAVHPDVMVFTVQREAAERMCASPGSKNYSAFSVLCSSLYRCGIAFDLGAGNFWPQPRVKSSVVVMRKLDTPCAHGGRQEFTRFTRDCFMSRRKMLRNNLKQAGYEQERVSEACSRSGIALDTRAEDLAATDFGRLFEALFPPA